MREHEWLAARFQENRGHLKAVAYRMLGSASEADDALQETWLKLSRSDSDKIENLGAWLTTVIARVCLDMLRSRTSRREESLEDKLPENAAARASELDPENEAVLADSIGLAVLIVLNKLDPAERIAFVLHDMFAVPFEEIGGIVGRSPAAARQLASRARRRVQGLGDSGTATPGSSEQRELVSNFLAALRAGDFEGLLAVLDPDVVVRVDAAAAQPGAPREIRGATNWAKGAVAFSRRVRSASLMLVDGAAGLVWAPRGKLHRVLTFTAEHGRITQIEIIGDPERLAQLSLSVMKA